jgi:Polyketide cyclase / dehydrase and lipid transport
VKAVVAKHIDIDAPPQQVWDRLFDWPRQGDWIPMTRVWVVGSEGSSGQRATDGHEIGARVEAWTGIGPIGFLDKMTVTHWDEPHVCEVEHTGRLVRGSGTFSVVALPEQRSRFHWREDLEVPFGRIGYWGFRIIRPAFMVGAGRALHKLKRLIESASTTKGTS